MKNSNEDLRNHLFETIEALKDEDNPMDIRRALAIKDVAQQVISSAKVDLQFMDLVGNTENPFFEKNRQLLPTPAGVARLPRR